MNNKKIKVKYEVYIVTDSRGESCAAVVNDESDCVQIYGLIDKSGAPLYFESEAWHLADECKRTGLRLSRFKKVETFEVEG
jgi:hypothetical protein